MIGVEVMTCKIIPLFVKEYIHKFAFYIKRTSKSKGANFCTRARAF